MGFLLRALFGSNEDPYKVKDYPDAESFADHWQFDFADELDCDLDEAYEEACDYWRENHKN